MLQNDKIPVIIIFAPTATGKTALALDFFGTGSHSFFKGKGELISADSMQVYRKLDIGTAKPSLLERQSLPHHLVDILDFDRQFTVSDFVNEADSLCLDIYSRNKIPLIVGGTAFYIKNFMYGPAETPESHPLLRAKLKERMEKEGKESLYNELKTLDPVSAEKININDEFRIIRALEIFYLTGKSRSQFNEKQTLRDKYDFLTIILTRERASLYRRIEERVDKMFEEGLKDEVFSLYRQGAESWMPGMKAIGYREWFSYLENKEENSLDIEKIKRDIKHSSKKYAKKQYTIMKDIPQAFYISMDNKEEAYSKILKMTGDFLEKYGFSS
ncbi:MAG: tRNA (adenosine(37)-N6)-dimethylallyltransferase MiaA [Treponema sp.]|nr:tRNA (adenosine(37)-N6)-dimethylallyltransferase MiaA [Treponema sp.]